MTVVALLAITLMCSNISSFRLCSATVFLILPFFFFLLRAIFFWARKKRENQIHASLLRAPTLVHNWDELDGSKKADRGG